MKKEVIITSFRKARMEHEDLPKFSSAVYQPKGFDYPKIDWMDIRYEGDWIRPREFAEMPVPLQSYRDALYALYLSRKDEVSNWVDDAPDRLVVCCWCPYDKAAQRQLKHFDSFVCHTAVIDLFLRMNYDNILITLDEDRVRSMVRFYPDPLGH